MRNRLFEWSMTSFSANTEWSVHAAERQQQSDSGGMKMLNLGSLTYIHHNVVMLGELWEGDKYVFGVVCQDAIFFDAETFYDWFPAASWKFCARFGNVKNIGSLTERVDKHPRGALRQTQPSNCERKEIKFRFGLKSIIRGIFLLGFPYARIEWCWINKGRKSFHYNASFGNVRLKRLQTPQKFFFKRQNILFAPKVNILSEVFCKYSYIKVSMGFIFASPRAIVWCLFFRQHQINCNKFAILKIVVRGWKRRCENKVVYIWRLGTFYDGILPQVTEGKRPSAGIM